MKVITLILALLVGVFAVTAFSCGGKSNVTPAVTGNTPAPSGNLSKTPMGIKLLLLSPLDASIQQEMDSALTKLFSDIKNRNYNAMINYSDYTITVKDDCTDRNGTKVWLDRL